MNKIPQPKLIHKFIWITVFAIAMGFLETSVVVYLRELLFPRGFQFPLANMSDLLIRTELLREAATILMLMGIGYFAGKSFSTRFAWFIYAFAIWDIFYYIFLKMLLNWPESWFTWDVLFLIPSTWTGPVLAPVITSFSMIILAITILYFDLKNINTRLYFTEWSWLILGSLIVIVSFMLDYSGFILSKFSLSQIWSVPNNQLLKLAQSYIPRHFNWWIFIIGQCVIFIGNVYYVKHRRG